jgi:hypothetical protein
MCLCCCVTRKSLLIYAVVISSFAFLYGILAISKFGSSTDIYKVLMDKIKELEEQNDYSSKPKYYDYKTKQKRRNEYDYPYTGVYGNYYTSKYAQAILNSASYVAIQNLKKENIETTGYGFIKSLKGIENGLGIVLFLFPIIFLIFEIIFLVYSCGIKEYKVLPTTTFSVLNGLKILCITISTILIFLSVLYGILLVIALVQYMALVSIFDSCVYGIIIGMAFGYYGFWYYIILSCAFCNERTKFLQVGTAENPVPQAQYDINGNPIARVVQPLQPVQPVIIAGQSIVTPQQVQVEKTPINNVPISNSNGIGDEYININGITYKRVDDVNIDFSERKNIKRNSFQKNTSNRRRSSKNKVEIKNIEEDAKSQNSKAQIV